MPWRKKSWKAKYNYDSVKQPAKKWELERVKEVEGHDKESIKRRLSSRIYTQLKLCPLNPIMSNRHNTTRGWWLAFFHDHPIVSTHPTAHIYGSVSAGRTGWRSLWLYSRHSDELAPPTTFLYFELCHNIYPIRKDHQSHSQILTVTWLVQHWLRRVQLNEIANHT